MNKIRLLEKTNFLSASQQDATGRVWEAVLIQAGVSKNQRYYSPDLLKTHKQLFEGLNVQAYQFGNRLPAYNHLPGGVDGTKHKFAFNTVGFFKNVRYGTFTNRAGELKEGLLAEFHILPHHAWLAESLKYAFEQKHEHILGFSIDARGTGHEGVFEGKRVQIVDTLEAAASTDIVSMPAAGGAVLRLVAGLGDFTMKFLLSLFKKFRPSWVKTIQEANLSEDELAKRILESAHQSASEALTKISVDNFEEMNAAARGLRTLAEAVNAVNGGKAEDAAAVLEPWLSTVQESNSSEYANFLYPTVKTPAPTPVPAPTPAPAAAVPATVQESEKVNKALQDMREELAKERNNTKVEKRLAESKLPNVSQSRVMRNFWDKVTLDESALTLAIREEQDYVNSITPAPNNSVTGLGGAYGQPGGRNIVMGQDKRDKLRACVDLMFTGQEVDKQGNRGFTSMLEAWAAYNPQTINILNREHIARMMLEAIGHAFPRNFSMASNAPTDAMVRHSKRVSENWNNIRSVELQEGIVSNEFTVAFGDSMFKRMQAIYMDDPAANWREIVSPGFTNLQDATRPYNIVRMGDIPVLPQVLERAAYQELIESPTEKVEKITPAKYGGVYSLTWESLLTDDLQYVRMIPALLAKSSNRRIARLVFNILESNQTLNADSVALFNSAHANLISGNPALAYSGIVAGVKLFRNQTAQDSLEKLGLSPSILLTGPAKEAAAWELTASDRKSTSGEDSTLDSFVKAKGIRPVMSVELGLTSTTEFYWYLLANPAQSETISVGFLGGRSVPDIFVQGEQTPTSGSFFDADVITFKARLVVGATAVDWRSFVRSEATS